MINLLEASRPDTILLDIQGAAVAAINDLLSQTGFWTRPEGHTVASILRSKGLANRSLYFYNVDVPANPTAEAQVELMLSGAFDFDNYDTDIETVFTALALKELIFIPERKEIIFYIWW